MGKLVEFDRRRRDSKPRTQKQTAGEILIFTGVRYERNDAKEPDKPSTASPRSKRKRG